MGEEAGIRQLALVLCLLCVPIFLSLTGCQAQNVFAESQDTSSGYQVGDEAMLETTPSKFDKIGRAHV